MKHFIKMTICFFVLFCIVSCDPELQVSYKVKNNTDKDIKLRYIIADTIETVIQTNETKTIRIENKIGTPNMADKYDDSITVFSYFTVQKDSLLWSKNFRDRSNWIFFETGKNSCQFELQINTDDF